MRHAFNISSAISLLLMLAAIALWIRSREYSPGAGWGIDVLLNDVNADPCWAFAAQSGQIVVTRNTGDGGMSAAGTPVTPGFHLPGFAYEGLYGPNGEMIFVTFSLRALVVIFAIVPAVWLFRFLRKRRKAIPQGFEVSPSGESKQSSIREPD